MRETLIVVDMQNDFIDGTLGTKEAQAIVSNVAKKIKEYKDRGDKIIFTRDTHDTNYLNTPEGKKLPVEHCIYGTDGWQIVDELKDDAGLCVLKPSFASFDLIDRIRTLSNAMNERPEIEICGTATDICVVSNALMLRSAFYNDKVAVNKRKT